MTFNFLAFFEDFQKVVYVDVLFTNNPIVNK